MPRHAGDLVSERLQSGENIRPAGYPDEDQLNGWEDPSPRRRTPPDKLPKPDM